MLPHTSLVGENSAEFFSIFNQFLDFIDLKLYLISKGFLKEICTLIGHEVQYISSLDAKDIYAEIDLSQGYVLKEFVKILVGLLTIPMIKMKFKQEKLVGVILDDYLALRSLVSQKSKVKKIHFIQQKKKKKKEIELTLFFKKKNCSSLKIVLYFY